MHKKATITRNRPRISKAVEELLNLAIENQETVDDIVCFLCNGQIAYGSPMFGPGERGITDNHQSEFLVDFMNSSEEELYTGLDANEEKERFQRFSLNIELMIYSHLWESELSLSNLKQLSNFIEGLQYDWSLKIPWQDKWTYITKKIRPIFKKYNLEIAEIISETYHSQLRNAFAHSQYGFFGQSIRLYNYSKAPHEFPSISYTDWETRFIKTVDMFLEISNQKFSLLKKIAHKKPIIQLWIPNAKLTKYYRKKVYWDNYAGYYSFNKNALRT